MNKEVYDVIAGYIKAVKLIVQGKGEVAYITPFTI
jgi:hypothetical protein